MGAVFKDHFSAVEGYAAHRPTYPPELVDFLAAAAPGNRMAWDAGCGSGQLSALLVRRFDQVIATDASGEQIARAALHPHIEYRQATAEDSGLADRSACLATCAQAVHWFDLSAYYHEVRRVCVPGAAFALVSYTGLAAGDPAIDRAVKSFYSGVVGRYWPPERRLVEAGYRDLPFPFVEIEAPPMEMGAEWTAVELCGYVETWSAVRAMERSRGRAATSAALDTLRSELVRAFGDPSARRSIRWPLALRVGYV